ncbi:MULTISPECIES: SpoIIIAH-like family protein [Bacillales]|uniref:SpoIIIAH-like family protein n=1 Tax=Lysinibacillus louembei TaxID=1470088 RepID=A0ABZ0RWM0_9BACI|nr:MULTISPECIES: SpoIIIAH-like family protein [Bacillales]MCT6922670.1 SpoIIIAH-like family protein [Metasolibacillus sp.]MCT6938991.1 SpoIIIAH-like family protein [Metasolibacillus sp.]WPK11436.1 SpoIIIAH-like family protein [Lysinibacillus louembei]
MKVKRKTVWFLTLFSLAAVISVYYVFEDDRNINLMAIFSDETMQETTLTGLPEETKAVQSENYLFEQMRMEVENERSQLREQYTQKIASDQYSAEEKNEAYNEMNALIKRDSAEAMLEMLIKSLGYSDAFVRVEDEKVAVTVMSDEMSKEEANEIIYVVMSEQGEGVQVTVNVQSNYY